jgi:hypothetical protein
MWDLVLDYTGTALDIDGKHPVERAAKRMKTNIVIGQMKQIEKIDGEGLYTGTS